MTTMRIDKIDVERRQIEAAIRLLFENENQIAAHTLAAAGSQIVRDLCEVRKIVGFEEFKDLIKPEHMKDYWRVYNRSANFFKHADKDGAATYEFNPEETDYVLLFAIKWYRDLGATPTSVMVAYLSWFAASNPNTLKEGATFGPWQPAFDKMKSFLNHVDRAERLELGKEVFAKVRAHQ